jgi:ATP-dependent helicase/nuclease subunit A
MSSPTPDQQRAIDANGDTLVVAGAGAGKTRTLVDRCLARALAEENPISIDRILMVTFTEAASAEMRRRIRERLEERLQTAPSAAIDRQLALLDTASICTLHSFCLQLVREHFYELELDPLVIVMDDANSKLLAAETLDGLLDKHYSGKTPDALAVQNLIHDLARGNDRLIRGLIMSLHAHAQSLPDPEDWLDAQSRMFESEQPEHWLAWLSEGVLNWSAKWRETLAAQSEENVNAAQCLKALSGLSATPESDQIAETAARIAEIDLSWPNRKKTRLREPIKKIFGEARFLRSITADPNSLTEDWQWSRPHMLALLGLTRDFEAAFSRAKKEQAAVDFSDLEQFTLRLLWDKVENAPTAIAREWRERLDLVFVDEYQDINAAQDRIIQAISREGDSANRFLVGDVKQSIYRFRQADPHIFQNRSDAWREPGAVGKTLPLSDNFRSHEGILQFANELFDGLMRREIGGVEFDDDARIRFGAPESRPHYAIRPDEPPRVELRLQLTGKDAAESPDDDSPADALADLSRVEKEARMAALRLRELMDQAFQVWDEDLGALRDAEWGDMVVLLRSPRGKAESYAKEFGRLGIPIDAARGGFYDTTEVSDFLSLLQILDNPLQDIPLLAVLRSPLVGMSLNELAALRLTQRKGPLWTALRGFDRESANATSLSVDDIQSTASESARPKVARFLESHAHWRKLARQGSLSQCLETAIDEGRYEDWLLTRQRGVQRRANLQRFLAQARQFDQFQRQGLFRFLKHIEAQRENELEPEPAGAESANAVRLISVHRSKGLEFPIVVFGELGGSFNLIDLRGSVILDEHHGLCPRVIPPGSHRGYPSLPYWLAAQRQRSELLGEELRLLYVAATRARDLLILTGSASRKSVEEKWNFDPNERVSTPNLLDANRYLDWIAPACARLTGDAEWNLKPEGTGPTLAWTFVASDDLSLASDAPPASVVIPTERIETDLDGLIERITWNYAHEDAAHEAAKASVTAIRRRLNETTAEEALPLFRQTQDSPASPQPAREALAGTSRLAAAAIGNAHHAFLQNVALDRTGDEESLRSEAERLVSLQALSRDEADALDLDALLRFWTSEMGAGIRARSEFVRRELPFTARFSLDEIESLLSGDNPAKPDEEFVVVQGAVDLVLVTEQAIEILDFKTDRMRESDLDQKQTLYGPQLKMYAAALKKIYRKPVTRAALHFLSINRTVEIDLPG